MNLLASKAQLQASLLRWSLFLIPLIVLLGFLGGQLGSPNTLWFQSLQKPAIFPPPATFGIVWSILYVMIGFSTALVASSWGAYSRTAALGLFAFHFLFNLAWTAVFFGAQDIAGGFIVIVGATVTLLPVIAAFWRIRRVAGLLLLPYLAWLLFASVLNYQFWAINSYSSISTPEPTQRIEI